MQLQITRLTSENLELHDKIDALNENIRKLKKQERFLAKKLRDFGGNTMPDSEPYQNDLGLSVPIRNVPSIRKKDREYLGMFSYKVGTENAIMKELVIGKFFF